MFQNYVGQIRDSDIDKWQPTRDLKTRYPKSRSVAVKIEDIGITPFPQKTKLLKEQRKLLTYKKYFAERNQFF